MTTATRLRVTTGGVTIDGDLARPDDAIGAVIFAHGSGSSRHSPRNRMVAGELNEHGIATVLLDLLTAEEERVDSVTRQFRFDVEMLAERLAAAADHVRNLTGLGIAYFGASTGAAAALIAAAQDPEQIRAVVSRGGRPDLAGHRLRAVRAPTLLICGGNDLVVIEMNRQALELMTDARTELQVVPGATHLFEEPGTLEQVAQLATEWFQSHFAR